MALSKPGFSRKVHVRYVRENFKTVDDYVNGISRQGLIEELGEFNVNVPNTTLTTIALQNIYKAVLTDYIERGY